MSNVAVHVVRGTWKNVDDTYHQTVLPREVDEPVEVLAGADATLTPEQQRGRSAGGVIRRVGGGRARHEPSVLSTEYVQHGGLRDWRTGRRTTHRLPHQQTFVEGNRVTVDDCDWTTPLSNQRIDIRLVVIGGAATKQQRSNQVYNTSPISQTTCNVVD